MENLLRAPARACLIILYGLLNIVDALKLSIPPPQRITTEHTLEKSHD